MAKTNSNFQFRGSIGNLTFKQTKNGPIVCRKSSLTKHDIDTRPEFELTRRQAAEFKTFTTSAAFFARVFKARGAVADNALHPRLVKLFNKILKADNINALGERKILPENLGLLKGVLFNKKAYAANQLNVDWDCDTVLGLHTATISSFNPWQTLELPNGTTHLKLRLIGAVIDFHRQEAEAVATSTDLLRVEIDTGTTYLTVNLPPESASPTILGLAIEFYQLGEREIYEMRAGKCNSFAIHKIITD